MSPKVAKTGFEHLREGYGRIYGRGNSRISFLEVATNFLHIFNIAATMVRQGDRVLLKQSDMHVAFNMAKMAKGQFSQAAIEKT